MREIPHRTVQDDLFTRIILEPGEIVVCDDCAEDYTDSTEAGGLLFQSKAICPKCSPKWEKDAAEFNEQQFIRAHCPADIAFGDWVRDVLRAADSYSAEDLAFATRLFRLVRWQYLEIEKAKESGVEMFMDVPDCWYDTPTWACANGHVSNRYLKSSRHGPVCLACQTRIAIVPTITENNLDKILNPRTENSQG